MFWGNFLKICNENNTTPNTVCAKLEFSNATATHWKNGSIPKINAVCKIADYFGVSVDYLLGRNGNNTVSTGDVTNNSGVIGQINAPTTIKNGTEISLSVQEQDLLRVYRASDGKTQTKIMQFIYEFDELLEKGE